MPHKFKEALFIELLLSDILVKELEEEKRDNFEKQKELLKEVLKRANKTEKQEYNEISDKQGAIIDRN